MLSPIQLKFGLSQQNSIGRFGNLLVGKPQPLVAPLVTAALQVCSACGLQVIE